MPSRASRWPGNDTPLTGVHGGTAQGALRAIKEARQAEANRRFQLGRDAAQKMLARAKIAGDSAPRKDRIRRQAPLPPRKERVTLWHCRKGFRVNHDLRAPERKRDVVQNKLRKMTLRIAQKNLCALCGKKLGALTSLDHCIPVSGNGPDMWGNLVLSHRECNTLKGNDKPTGCELIWLFFVNGRLGPEITKGMLT